jgi:phage terminase Nu1 subunit (DNA packaging protein)
VSLGGEDSAAPAHVRLLESRAKREAAMAELAAIEVLEKRAALVPADEVRAKFAEVIGVARTKLLGVPTRCKQRMPHLTSADVRLIDDIVREALEGLVNR